MSWKVAIALDTLLGQLNAMAPSRSKISDGAIGDAEHATRDSDHNPWVKDGDIGIVTARDFTHDPEHGADMYKVAAELVASRDSRIKYIILGGRICRSYAKGDLKAWTWAPYYGINAHKHHLHLSVKPEKKYWDDERLWKIKPQFSKPTKRYSMVFFALNKDLLSVVSALAISNHQGVICMNATEVKNYADSREEVIVVGGPAVAALGLTVGTGVTNLDKYKVLNGATGKDTDKLLRDMLGLG